MRDPYQRHSATSRDAAEAQAPKSQTRRAAVLAAIRQSFDGLTDEQIQRQLNMDPSTQRPRRVELVEMGRVIDSGRVRKTISGRNATVWIVPVAVEPGQLGLGL